MLPLRLNCLGIPRLAGSDGTPIHLRTKKHLGLLIYLAIEPPVPHRRDRLAALLWPTAGEREGRHSLATALSVLRSHLGKSGLDRSRDTVRLVPGHVDVDIAGSTEVGVEEDNLSGFLEDFEIPDASDFSHWVDRLRARVMPMLRERLARRIETCRRTGDTAGMGRVADYLQRLDPLSEEAVRALIESRSMAGDRIGALRVFTSWQGRLAEELGATPSLDLERLAERLRSSRSSSVLSKQESTGSVDGSSNHFFLGRTDEFNLCYDNWKVAKLGRLRQVNLLGERGIGRSALLGRVAAAAALDGGSVASAAGHLDTRQIPYALLQDLTNSLLDLPGAGGTEPEALAVLAAIAPSVRAKWTSLPTTQPLEMAPHTLRHADSLGALIRSVAEEHPLFIAIDDVNIADPLSIVIISRALRVAAASPVLVVLTHSPCSMPVCESVAPDTSTIEVQGLALNETHELIRLRGAGDSGTCPTALRVIASASKGNPHVLHCLLSNWERDGYDSAAFHGQVMSPAKYVASRGRSCEVTALTKGLDPEAGLALSLASLLNGRLSDPAMYSIVQLSRRDALKVLYSLTQSGVLVERGAQLQFRDAILQAEWYHSTPPCIRQSLHSEVADRLRQMGQDCDVRGLELAWHLFRAGRKEEGAAFLITGCRDAIRSGTPHQAELALVSGLDALTGAQYQEGVLLLAEAQQEVGQWEQSLSTLSLLKSPTTAQEEYESEAIELLALRALGRISGSALSQGTDKLIAAIRASTSTRIRAKAAATAVRLLTLSWDAARITVLDDAVRGIVDGTGEPFDELHFLLARAWTCSALGAVDESLQVLQQATALAQKHSFGSTIFVRLLVGLGNTHSVSGRYDLAIEPLETAESIARRLGNDTLMAECSTQLATAFGRLGQSPAQIDWARQANIRFPAQEWSPGTMGANYELGLGLALEGRLEEARSVAVGLLTSLPQDRPAWIRQASLLCAADVMALSGHSSRGARLARTGIEVGDGKLLNQSYAGQYARWIAHITIEDSIPEDGLRTLESQFPRIEKLHFKDRAELSAARACLRRFAGTLAAAELDDVRLGFAGLPPGISAILRGLGLHPDQSGWRGPT
jgi:DNA-binding SARP family transcriptional activator/tetratricopeptide (TPR) repeat protein